MATAFAPNIIWWCIFRFFVGLTIPAILHIPFVICQLTSFTTQLPELSFRSLNVGRWPGYPYLSHLYLLSGLEVVAPSKRTLVSFYSNMFYVAGLMGFSGVAYVLPQWKLMALATSLPFVIYYLYIL